MKPHESVDEYIESEELWRDELIVLRGTLRKAELEETIKWGAPCYMHAGRNVVGMAAFKSYVGLWFHDGVLLEDPDGVLINAQQGKTKSLRQWRFTQKKDIKRRRIKVYVDEAVAIARELAAQSPRPRAKKKLRMPAELDAALGRSKRARAFFDALTPGKQREYADYVTEAKQAATKKRRVEKILPMIREGRGLNDKYR